MGDEWLHVEDTEPFAIVIANLTEYLAYLNSLQRSNAMRIFTSGLATGESIIQVLMGPRESQSSVVHVLKRRGNERNSGELFHACITLG